MPFLRSRSKSPRRKNNKIYFENQISGVIGAGDYDGPIHIEHYKKGEEERRRLREAEELLFGARRRRSVRRRRTTHRKVSRRRSTRRKTTQKKRKMYINKLFL